MNCKTKILQAKNLKKESDENFRETTTRIGDIVDSVYRELVERYPILLDTSVKDLYQWHIGPLNAELQLMARAMVRLDSTVIHLYNKEGFNTNYCITGQHGIKQVRCHGGHCIIPYRAVSASLIKEIYETPFKSLDFSVLKNEKQIHQKKLKVYLQFLRKVLRLWKEWIEIDKEKDEYLGSRKYELREYSSINNFEQFLDLEPDLKVSYPEISRRLEAFKLNQDALLEEMKVINKPFRLLISLRNGPSHYSGVGSR